MKKKRFFRMLALLLTLGMAVVGCDDGSTDDGEDELLEVTHVNGFQGVLSDGSLIEIEVASTADGNQSFNVYVSGMKTGTGTLTLSGGSIIAIVNCTDSSITYSGGVRYSGFDIRARPADGKVWVHWGAYYGVTMNNFNNFAQQNGGDADRMYTNRPNPDDQGYYYGYPSSPTYDTVQSIYYQACQDHSSDKPPKSVLNQAIRVLNDHKNTGVGAYVSRGNLIAYYFQRIHRSF
jgi:formylglycine-generating enzyme required for sulfatase activity